MKKDEDITIEEAQKVLDEMEIPVGTWENTEPSGDAEAFTIPSFKRIAGGLENLKELLGNQIKEDQNKIAELNMKLNRLKYGGGR